MSFDANGLTTKREPELLLDIEGFQSENIPEALDYQNNKLIYQLNSVYAKSAAEINELLETVYDSMALSKAEGIWLDELALLRGVTRIPALASFTRTQYVVLTPGSTVPAGSLWSSSVVTYQATNENAVTSDESQSSETVMLLSSDIDLQPDGVSYGITVNSVTYSYTSVPSDGLAEVVAGLTAEFDADTGKTWSYTTETTGAGEELTITPDIDTVVATTSLTTFITTVSTKNYTTVSLTVTGPIEIPANSFDTLITAVSGLIETNNDEAFIVGRDQETDEELRLRVAAGPVGDCTGTILTIQSGLLENVPGVSIAVVEENVTDFPNDGIAVNPYFPDGTPFGGYQTLVVGGDDNDVAAEVWRTKPAGVPAIGNTQIMYTDSSGKIRTVYFSRPEQIHLAFEVEYTRYDEESFPANGDTAIQNSVVAQTNALSIDEDVIPSRYFGPIYSTVSGIDSLVVKVQQIAAPGDTPVPANWQTTRFPISDTQYASTEAQDVVVIDVTPP